MVSFFGYSSLVGLLLLLVVVLVTNLSIGSFIVTVHKILHPHGTNTSMDWQNTFFASPYMLSIKDGRRCREDDVAYL